MKTYEYIRLYVDLGDLAELNKLASAGWKVAALHGEHGQLRASGQSFNCVALLERPLPPK